MSDQYEKDQMDYTPEMALTEALERVRKDPDQWNGCVVLLVNNETSSYQTGYHLAGLKLSEAVGLLECVKFIFLKSLGKPWPRDEDK